MDGFLLFEAGEEIAPAYESDRTLTMAVRGAEEDRLRNGSP